MEKKMRELVMAKLYLKNKDYKMAEKSFNEYLNTNPEDVVALKLLAQVYEHNKQFEKAFEMYERCYLAEPDRTGVLLDICRILLIKEIWLEHVDYRRWLNLAIKAFPNNPIVVNFKSFLSTLPPEERESPKILSRPPGDDLLSKILEKLSILDSRLEKIETKIGGMSLNTGFNSTLPNKQSTADLSSQLTPSPLSNSFGTPKLAEIKQVDPKPAELKLAEPKPAEFKTAEPKPVEPKLNSPSKQTTPAWPSNNLSLFGAPTTTTPLSSGFGNPSLFPSFGQSLFGAKPASTVTTSTTTSTSLTTASGSIFGVPTPSIFGQKSLNDGAPSTFALPTFNPFAASMHKNNIPTEGTWVSNPPTLNLSGRQDEEEENENVPTEELPIENTCEMTPIEIKTGEEDENVVFEYRCKLFRLKDKEYKERGLGNIKVLKHKTTGKGRLIMRRDAIGLVCLNCWNCKNIERVKENQVRWIGLDASDDEPTMTVFLAKFKTAEITDTFLSNLNKLFSDDLNESSASTSSAAPQDLSKNNASVSKPEIELVDPKLDPQLVDKARKLQLPDLFYHKLKNQDSCAGCDGCQNDS